MNVPKTSFLTSVTMFGQLTIQQESVVGMKKRKDLKLDATNHNVPRFGNEHFVHGK